MVYLLLQNFLLVGIKDILIIGGAVDELLGTGNQYGVTFQYIKGTLSNALLKNDSYTQTNTIIIFGNVLIYGANLTRKYQSLMYHLDYAAHLKTDAGELLPIIFCTKKQWDNVSGKIQYWENAQDMLTDMHPIEREFTRGVIALPMNDKDQILTASRFVQIIEQVERREIANIEEIAISRGLKKRRREEN